MLDGGVRERVYRHRSKNFHYVCIPFLAKAVTASPEFETSYFMKHWIDYVSFAHFFSGL